MNKTAKKNDEVQLGICARIFWVICQKTFFDLRVFDPNGRRYPKQTLKWCYSINKNEKKRYYNARTMGTEQGSFTTLIFTVAEGIGVEGRAFYSWLPTLFSLKNWIEKSKVTSWIQSKVNFALLRSMLLCLRGSRQNLVNEKLDIELEHTSYKNKWSKLLYKPYFCVFFNKTIIVQLYICNRWSFKRWKKIIDPRKEHSCKLEMMMIIERFQCQTMILSYIWKGIQIFVL